MPCRGKLCTRCNRALGGFKDSPQLLRAAAEYLERWEDCSVLWHMAD